MIMDCLMVHRSKIVFVEMWTADCHDNVSFFSSCVYKLIKCNPPLKNILDKLNFVPLSVTTFLLIPTYIQTNKKTPPCDTEIKATLYSFGRVSCHQVLLCIDVTIFQSFDLISDCISNDLHLN
jgi:hypothetical protein